MAQMTSARARRSVVGAFFAQGLGFAVVLTHLPTIADRWRLDDLAITGVMFGVAILAGAGSSVAGVMSARVGSSVALRAALLIAAGGLAVSGLAGTFWMFLCGVALYGIGLGMVDASENMQAVALEADYGRSILTSFHAAWSAGGIVGAVYTSITTSALWSLPQSLPLIAVVVGALSMLPFLPGLPSPGGSLEPPATPGSRPWRPLLLLGVALVLFYVADSAASSWSTLYLRDGLGAAAGVAPLAYGSYQATSLVSRLLGDLLVRRNGAVAVVRLAAGTGTVGLLMVVLAPGPVLAIVGFAVLGAGLAVVAPLTFSAAGALAGSGTPEQRRAQADVLVARLNQFNYLGFVLGGVLTGLVSSAGSLRWGFVVPLVLTVVLIPLARVFAPGVRPAGAVTVPDPAEPVR